MVGSERGQRRRSSWSVACARAHARDLATLILAGLVAGSALRTAIPALAQDRARGPLRRRGGGERGPLPGPGAARRAELPQRRRRRDERRRGQRRFRRPGTRAPADSRVTVDLRTLRSDEARRDNYVRRNTLETERFPTVTFVPIRGAAPAIPAPAERLGVRSSWWATSRSRMPRGASRGTRRPPSTGPGSRVRARTAFRFGDFGLRVPRVSVVLSVEDDIKLEADLVLRRSS